MRNNSLLRKGVVLTLIASFVLAGCGQSAGGDSKSGSASSNIGNKQTQVVDNEDKSKLVPIDGDDGIDASGLSIKTYDSCLVAGDTAYEFYGYNKATAERYANIVKKGNSVLNGAAKVYDILIPTAMDVTMPDALRKTVKNSSDQKEGIKSIYDMIGDAANCVWIMDTLRQHKKDYLYYRSDHHWTALAGYYAYKEFCKAKGIQFNDLNAYEKVTFDNFLGSFYTHTKDEGIASNPDVVEAYVPLSTNDMTFTDKSGKETQWKVIKDVTSWGQGTKYNTFIGGDNPYSVIKNPKLKDGSACLILKESFGNAVVPFFVDHYENVYVVDYRYYTGTLSNFLKDHKIDDMIFLTSVSAGMGGNNLSKLENFMN